MTEDEHLEVLMSSLSRLPWAVAYLARRTAGASLMLAETVGVAAFPSRPPADLALSGWAAGYAAGSTDALPDGSLVTTTP